MKKQYFFFFGTDNCTCYCEISDIYLQELFQKELLSKEKFIISAFRNYNSGTFFFFFLMIGCKGSSIVMNLKNGGINECIQKCVFLSCQKKIFPYLNGSYVIRVTTPNQTKLKQPDPFILYTDHPVKEWKEVFLKA